MWRRNYLCSVLHFYLFAREDIFGSEESGFEHLWPEAMACRFWRWTVGEVVGAADGKKQERWHLLGRNQVVYIQFCHGKRLPEEGPVTGNTGIGSTESEKRKELGRHYWRVYCALRTWEHRTEPFLKQDSSSNLLFSLTLWYKIWNALE